MTTQAFDEIEDPFEAFDRANGSGTVRDPYPHFAALRAKGAVHQVDIREAMGLDPTYDLPDVDMPPSYSVVRYEELAQVLRDGHTFSSSGYSASIGLVMGHSILEMDEPEHHMYRGLVQQAFTRKAMERWESELVRPIVDGFIDRFTARGDGRADLVRELTFPFPVHVIAAMLGLPEADLDRFHAEAVAMTNIGGNFERAMQASQWLHDYFAEILAERRAHPGSSDVITVLADAELNGDRLTDEDIFAFLRLLLPAGAETTYRSSSNLLYALLATGQIDALREDRSLMAQAIEEGLRWEPPLTGIGRTATRDVDIGGVTIPAGAIVSANMGAANHDERRWDNAEAFDLFREPKQHLAFAFGPHMCLGMHLARMETAVAVNAVLDRLPDLRLDPEAEDVHITGLAFRAPRSLPVLFS